MNGPSNRGRAPLFGSNATSNGGPAIDPESLEKENDRGIESLGDRVGLLRNLTHGIKSEVDSQNKTLDGMADTMGMTSMGLQGAVTRFKRVFDTPQKQKTFYFIIGTVGVLFLLYLWVSRRG
eukprot:jgi/Botrbrau1/12261/Bobra.0323s0004.1